MDAMIIRVLQSGLARKRLLLTMLQYLVLEDLHITKHRKNARPETVNDGGMMTGLIIYSLSLLMLSFLLSKFVRTYWQVFGLAFAISALLCSIYQAVNYLLYGPDRFVAIAIAVQFTGSLIGSFLFGALYLRFKKKQLCT